VALTGTDAGSNALFGNVQKVTAERLGLAPVLMSATNSSGGVMGKMIDAQSIVVASAPTQQVGREAEIFRAVIKHSLVLAAIVGLIVTAYAFLVPGWVPRIGQPRRNKPRRGQGGFLAKGQATGVRVTRLATMNFPHCLMEFHGVSFG